MEPKCTYFVGTKEKSPHSTVRYEARPKIFDNILEVIGGTPIVKLNSIP